MLTKGQRIENAYATFEFKEFTILLSSPAELACDLEVLAVPPAARKSKCEVVQESEVLPEATEVDGGPLGQVGTPGEP